MIVPYDRDINEQLKFVTNILKQNKLLMKSLDILKELNINNCYITAGIVTQSVINCINNLDITSFLSDIDIQYYDNDTSYEAEDTIIKLISSEFRKNNINTPLDIKNEARVHIWIKERYGRDIKQYTSVENAVSYCVATIQSIAVKKDNNGNLLICAPYGFNDLLKGIIRPIYHENNTKEQYYKKVKDWTERWKFLKVIDWKN